MQIIFLAPLQYLKLEILYVLQVQGDAVFEKGKSWTADDSLGEADDVTDSLGLNEVDVMSWGCGNGGERAIAGKAYLGRLCTSLSTNINEKRDHVADSGFVRLLKVSQKFRS